MKKSNVSYKSEEKFPADEELVENMLIYVGMLLCQMLCHLICQVN